MARQANRKKPIIPKPYPIDLRERLVRAVEGGMSVRKAARRLMINYSSALKWMGQFPYRPSTVCGLWKTIGDSLHAFTANECQNFFKAAGYSVN
jgi:hypothetical protein